MTADISTPPTQEELIAARLELARLRLSIDATQNNLNGGSTDKNSPIPDIESFSDQANKLGYSVGTLVWALSRVEKVERTLQKLAEALGESLDEQAVVAASVAVVEGFARAQQQYRFPSPAVKRATFLDPSAASEAIYREFAAARPDNIVSRLIKLIEG